MSQVLRYITLFMKTRQIEDDVVQEYVNKILSRNLANNIPNIFEASFWLVCYFSKDEIMRQSYCNLFINEIQSLSSGYFGGDVYLLHRVLSFYISKTVNRCKNNVIDDVISFSNMYDIASDTNLSIDITNIESKASEFMCGFMEMNGVMGNSSFMYVRMADLLNNPIYNISINIQNISDDYDMENVSDDEYYQILLDCNGL